MYPYEYKKIEQLSLTMELGDMDDINKHVQHRYKLIKNQLLNSQKQLADVVNILKLKNPSLIAQIKEAAMLADDKL